MAELVRCEVLMDIPIVDFESNEDVLKGDVVKLDPTYTNIPVLVECGLVKILADAPAPKLRKEL